MKFAVGESIAKVKYEAIDRGLSLTGPIGQRNSAFGLVLPEYVLDDYLAIKDLLVWRWRVPDGAYEVLSDGSRLCTPEFTFLLLARLVRVEELALFGLELCGTYAIDKSDPRGFVSGVKQRTTLKKLTQFLDGCGGAPGTRAAAQALRWVTDLSASPMESMLVLLLCLPRRLGGFGLPMPELNVSVNQIRGFGNPKEGPFVDLFWRIACFSLEYDSDLEHTGKDRIARDSIRRVLLEELKIRSFSVTNAQVNSSAELERVARITAKALGKKFHAVKRELRLRNTKLRKRLYEFTSYEADDAR